MNELSMPATNDQRGSNRWYVAAITTVGNSSIYFAMAYFMTKYAYGWHVWFGFVCSLSLADHSLLLVTSGYEYIQKKNFHWTLLKLLREPLIRSKALKDDSDDPGAVRRRNITFFVPVVVYFLASWSSLAYGFARLLPNAYAHPERITYPLMLRHYLWQLVDMVPLVDAWKHVHVEDPLPEAHLWPGFLVIVFRLVFLYVVVRTAAQLVRRDQRKDETG